MGRRELQKQRFLSAYILILLSTALLFLPPPAASQGQPPPFINPQIRVQVRSVRGPAAPRGILVRLETEQGSIVTQDITDMTGKVIFIPPSRGVYTVTISERGYQPVRQRVDLTMSSTAFLMIELRPIPGENSNFAPETPKGIGPTVSATELAIPQKAREEFEKGRKLLVEKHDVRGGVDHLQKAVKIHNEFPEALVLLGTAYLGEGKWKDALDVLQKATELDPKSGPAYLELGACLNQQKSYEAAAKALTRGLELNPEAPEGHYELAKAYWELGRWPEAEPHVRKVLSLRPELAPAHVILANVLLRKRDPAGALHEYREYIKLAPQGPMAAPVRAMIAKLEKSLKHPQ